MRYPITGADIFDLATAACVAVVIVALPFVTGGRPGPVVRPAGLRP